jgi:hypothetical protein
MAQVNSTPDKRVEESTASSRADESWVTHIWHEVADLNFCKYWFNPRSVVPSRTPSAAAGGMTVGITHYVIGTQANVASTQVLAKYLVDTVTRLSLAAAQSGRRLDFRLGASHRLGHRLQELKLQRAAGNEKPESDGSELPALADLYAVHEKENDDLFAALHSFKPALAKFEPPKNFSAYLAGAKAADEISLNSQVDERKSRLLK